ncbi:MAG: hypothetical protein JOZ92_06405 [Candidatus Dormibacteraeota bacterium]|nr:hypothetical protein [Candidatus Dormibacteraeota bacterium]
MALATCAAFPELDDDDQLLRVALREANIDAQPVVWDDETVDWTRFALTVVRDTWDYVERRDEFLTWASRVPLLCNDAAVLRWNTDKLYLDELQRRGVPIVPTTWLMPGDDIAALRLDGELVVKPAISAGSRNTERYSAADEDEARQHVARLLAAGNTVMVQPYLHAVEAQGETALLYIDGEYSHAARKAAILVRRNVAGDALFAAESISAHVATDAERAAGDRVLTALPFDATSLLYARVDLVPAADGTPLVLEVELAEPSLFFRCDTHAAARMAEAIHKRLL